MTYRSPGRPEHRIQASLVISAQVPSVTKVKMYPLFLFRLCIYIIMVQSCDPQVPRKTPVLNRAMCSIQCPAPPRHLRSNGTIQGSCDPQVPRNTWVLNSCILGLFGGHPPSPFGTLESQETSYGHSNEPT